MLDQLGIPTSPENSGVIEQPMPNAMTKNHMSALSATSAPTMSSREIAELTGKNHQHITRDIRGMLDQLGLGQSNFGHTYRDSQGKAQPCFNLPKDLTLTLVAGYSIPLRHRIVTRWQELEAQVQAPAVPTNFREAMLLALEKHEQLEAAQQHAEPARANVS